MECTGNNDRILPHGLWVQNKHALHSMHTMLLPRFLITY
uniref:Uncharacterized protein n=1 Tax=Arundo donax TaxID=35708 RepID=A0A0A9F6R2_ARUDO